MPTGPHVKAYPLSIKYKGKYKMVSQHNAGWLEARYALRGTRHLYMKLQLPTGEVHVSFPIPVVREMLMFLSRDRPLSHMTSHQGKILHASYKGGPLVDRMGRVIKSVGNERE